MGKKNIQSENKDDKCVLMKLKRKKEQTRENKKKIKRRKN